MKTARVLFIILFSSWVGWLSPIVVYFNLSFIRSFLDPYAMQCILVTAILTPPVFFSLNIVKVEGLFTRLSIAVILALASLFLNFCFTLIVGWGLMGISGRIS